MSAWTFTDVNGALADSLVTSFGLTGAVTTALPQDARFCLHFDYAAVAAGQVRLWLATAAGVANNLIVMIYDSANQTPVADSTQYLTDVEVSVPLISLQPMSLRITKSNTNARIRWYYDIKMGPGC